MTSVNITEVKKQNGTIVLISYTTPVAAWVPEQGFYRTNEHYSATTTKHINKWLISQGADVLAVMKVSPQFIAGLL